MSSCVKISGPEATEFLQGQLTTDVSACTETPALTAHCNTKGRVVFLAWIQKIENEYFLTTNTEMHDIMLAALEKYGFFSDCEITPIENHNITLADHAQRLAGGIPNLYPDTSGTLLPHKLGLPQLGAVHFKKGCYIGQEIIARTQYRGKVKDALFLAKWNDGELTRKDNVIDFCLKSKTALVLLPIDTESPSTQTINNTQCTITSIDRKPL